MILSKPDRIQAIADQIELLDQSEAQRLGERLVRRGTWEATSLYEGMGSEYQRIARELEIEIEA